MGGFESLHPVVQHHIVNELQWRELRPLQQDAIDPLLSGYDALLLAPTAGGKTEAALFPLLTRMANESWSGTSVLYVCPLRALLNNLEGRVDGYSRWLGRRASVRHGDTTQGERRRQIEEQHDILLTTPESLESLLISTKVDAQIALAGVRAVVVDEVHAFAGDDRGWHLLAVLERVERIAGRPLQRIGLSATVGNPAELLGWLQGSGRGARSGAVIAPPASGAAEVDLQVDYVGSIQNAGLMISRLHAGEKRLVFLDSRRGVEQLAVRLRELQVETHVSHSSLSRDKRRRAEAAFAESRNCVITATSTLELGIDVGDLDRVVQIGAPATVASFLQRLGRTGRRPGSTRNMLFLATDDDELLQAVGLGLLWAEGFVEPIVPPPEPNHIAAQQLLGLALQERSVGRNTWSEWFAGLDLAAPETLAEIANWLVETGYLDTDAGMLFVGPEAEQRYGRRHFLELMSVFTSDPQITVRHGRDEIGTLDPAALLGRVDGPRAVLLGGRRWRVLSVDWRRRLAWVTPTDLPAHVRWMGQAAPLSFELANAMRQALLGADPPGLRRSRRAENRLEELRQVWASFVDEDRTVLARESDQVNWWTWAGQRANLTIQAALKSVAPGLVGDAAGAGNLSVPLSRDAGFDDVRWAVADAVSRFGKDLGGVSPLIEDEAVDGLKFSDLLPRSMAERTLAERMADRSGVEKTLRRSLVGRVLGE